MTEVQERHMLACPLPERPHYRVYVERHSEEYARDWGTQGETALIIDATIYADLVTHYPRVASDLWPAG